VLLDVGDEDKVLLRRPRALLDALLVAARRPHHGVVVAVDRSTDHQAKREASFSADRSVVLMAYDVSEVRWWATTKG